MAKQKQLLMKFEGLKLRRGAARGILTTTSIVIDISRGIAINVVHACIHGSFPHSSIGACCIATPT
jgi:hypothetical protein